MLGLELLRERFVPVCRPLAVDDRPLWFPASSSDLLQEVPLRKSGKVKWFNETKGYGFIRQDTGRDIFVHYSEIEGDGFRTLAEGETVEFDMREGPRGLEALKVSRAGAEA